MNRIHREHLEIAINLYRLLRAYVYLRDTVGPENYWLNLGTWDNLAHDAFNAMMTWTGDGLVVSMTFFHPNLYDV